MPHTATAMTDASKLNIDFSEQGRRAWWISICRRPYFILALDSLREVVKVLWPHLPNCQLATVSDDGWFFIKAHIYPTPIYTFKKKNHKMYTRGWGHRNRCDNTYNDLQREKKSQFLRRRRVQNCYAVARGWNKSRELPTEWLRCCGCCAPERLFMARFAVLI